MGDVKGETLPYRTTVEDLSRLIENRARGRTLDQIQTLNYSSGSFAGSLLAAQHLGLMDPESDQLTELGRAYALSPAGGDERVRILRKALSEYEPYGLLLDAVLDGRPEAEETPLEWVETWWGSHGYGSSETNRSEASSAFGRLLDAAGVGTYIRGRRGHPTRIRWVKSALALLRGAEGLRPAGADQPLNDDAETESLEASGSSQKKKLDASGRPENPEEEGSRLVLQLGRSRRAELKLPERLTNAEKERLLKLVDLMIVVDESYDPENVESEK